MKLAHNIVDENTYLSLNRHSNYNSIQQIIECSDEIGFDGIYKNVFDNHECLRNKKGVFFIMGNFVGLDNSFDLANVPRLEKYCSWQEIAFLISRYDFKIGWHTWSHPDLTTLDETDIMYEITPPFPMDLFAYPYGKFNDKVIECVKRAGYRAAWSVTQGSQNPSEKDYEYKIYRPYI